MRDEDLPKRPQPLDAPRLSWRAAHTLAKRLMAEQATQHGFNIERETWLWQDREQGVYYYAVKSSRDIGRDGHTRIAFDANTSVLKSLNLPTGQYAGDTVTAWLTSLHMARVFGRPMQVFVCTHGPGGADALRHGCGHLAQEAPRAARSIRTSRTSDDTHLRRL